MSYNMTTASAIWPAWTSAAATDCTYTITTTTAGTWRHWVADCGTSTNTITNVRIWQGWVEDTTINETSYVIQPTYALPKLETPEQVAARERRAHQQRTKMRLLEGRRREPARQKSLSLLERVLSPEKWLEYRRHGSVRVTGSVGGVYQVGVGYSDKVYQLDRDMRPVKKLCVGPGHGHYPEGDHVAAVVLALVADELGVLARANVHQMDENEVRRVVARRERKQPQPTRRTA